MKIFLIVSWFTIGFLTMSLFFEPIKDVSAQDDDLRIQLKKMEEMMQKQQEMIDNLKTKMDIQEEVSTSYVTSIDEREIGNKMEEYLQKAEGQGLLEKYLGPCELGYKKGFYFRTRDDKFFMRMTGRIQMRYGYSDFDNVHDSDEEQDDSSFQLRRARLKWDGYAFKYFKYKIELALKSTGTKSTSTDDGDKAKAVELIDWWASYNKNPALSVQFGQWKVPWNRQRVISSAELQLIDRATSQDEFNQDRQIGAMLHGKLFNKKFEYYAGMFNGNGRNESSNGNNEHLYIARVSWNPFGAFGSGIGEKESDLDWSEKPKAHLSAAIAFDGGADETIELEPRYGGEIMAKEVDKTSIVGEYGLKYKGFSTKAEFYWRKFDNIKTHSVSPKAGTKVIDRGFFVQGGYFLIPKKFEVAGRYSLVDFDNSRVADATRETTVGLSWFFHGHGNKLQANWIRIDNEKPNFESRSDDIDNFYRIQYQLAF